MSRALSHTAPPRERAALVPFPHIYYLADLTYISLRLLDANPETHEHWVFTTLSRHNHPAKTSTEVNSYMVYQVDSHFFFTNSNERRVAINFS
jgi:hypothetical protein